jgi:CheY-like chemotaxis protein
MIPSKRRRVITARSIRFVCILFSTLHFVWALHRAPWDPINILTLCLYVLYSTFFGWIVLYVQARFEWVNTETPRASLGTVLVVDDEADVLRLIQSILVEDGYEVVPAKNADSAIKSFQRMSRHPDLLLTDVVMPGMSGPMLVDHLLSLEPNLRVLFMSGFDERQVVQRYVVEKGFRLIPKPFTVKALRAAIRAAINGVRTSGPAEPTN